MRQYYILISDYEAPTNNLATEHCHNYPFQRFWMHNQDMVYSYIIVTFWLFFKGIFATNSFSDPLTLLIS